MNAPHRQILCTDQNDTLAANQDSFAETRREFNLSDETLAKMMKRRNCIAEEFLSTERTYLKELLSLEELYMTPLEAAKEILNKDDLLLLFANLKDIIKVHKMQLLPLIQAAVSHSDQPLGSALCKVLPLLKICRVNYKVFLITILRGFFKKNQILFITTTLTMRTCLYPCLNRC